MKKIIIIALVACLCACSKSSPSFDPSTAITGKWLASSVTIVYYLAGNQVYTSTNQAVPTSYYYSFNGGVAGTYIWDASKAAYVKTISTDTYTLTNSNKTLNYNASGVTMTSYGFAFVDANKITLSEELHINTYYVKADKVSTGIADDAMYIFTYTRM